MKKIFYSLAAILLVAGCDTENQNIHSEKQEIHSIKKDRNLIKTGETIRTRISAPEGYKWMVESENSYEKYLQDIDLKPSGTQILDYLGNPISNQSSHVAILNFDVGKKDLQQCADAVIRIRAEYLWARQKYEEIGFHFTSGDYFSWKQYNEGYRPQISGNQVSFMQTANADDSYTNFRKYLDVIYTYAGTISLNKETVKISNDREIKAGDILITPGSPGHVVFICGKAQDKNGLPIYLLAEGYTPAQSIHIITNPFDENLNPWYRMSTSDETTQTARYSFSPTNIRTFGK